METESLAPARARRWLQRAEPVSDAFGLVLILVITTYVLASLLGNQGWSAVMLMVATSATSIVALTSSHARPGFVRRAVWSPGCDPARGRLGGLRQPAWLNVASLTPGRPAGRRDGRRPAARRHRRQRSPRARSSARSASTRRSASSSPGPTGLIDRIEGGGFFGKVPTQGGDFLFFSYTTLTTTGYGNLVPGGQPGRMIAGLEMMIGQIFLVTLVAGPGQPLAAGRGPPAPPRAPRRGRRRRTAQAPARRRLVGELDALDHLRLDRPVAEPSVGVASIASTASIPSTTLPKTVCLPSSQGAASVVTMKNCEPFVFGPALAIASAPRTILWSLNSSSKV